MFFELRQYVVRPGQQKAWVRCMEEEIIPFQVKMGMVILGECVTDREAPFTLPRYPTAEAVARTAAFIDKWNGRLEGRLRAWAMPFSPETCSAELL